MTLPHDRPVVFIAGRPEPTLAVATFTSAGRLNRRTATLTSVAVDPPRLQGEPVTLAVPHRLADGDVAWQVLLRGAASTRGDRDQADRREDMWGVTDEFTDALDQAPSASAAATLRNATTLHEMIHQLIGIVSAALSTPTRLGLLGITDEPHRPTNVTAAVGVQLEALLAARGLRLGVDERFDGRRMNRLVRVVPEAVGQRVALSWGDADTSPGEVTEVRSERAASGAAVLVVSGEPSRVELTATLNPAWDAALQDRPDDDYRTDITDADPMLADVFRLWLLNEDAALPDVPAFDLAQLFDDDHIVPAAVPFSACLTLDAAGQPRPPIVELSTDAGITWLGFSHNAELLADRAGVRLVAPALPAELLAAARLGDAQLRVTATLTSPRRTELLRHVGNPFLGQPATATHRFDDLHHRRVDASSIHADAVAQGTLAADLRDDRPVLHERLRRLATEPSPSGKATLTLAGTDPTLIPGTRLLNAGGPDRTLDDRPQTTTRHAPSVTHLHVNYLNATTTITL